MRKPPCCAGRGAAPSGHPYHGHSPRTDGCRVCTWAGHRRTEHLRCIPADKLRRMRMGLHFVHDAKCTTARVWQMYWQSSCTLKCQCRAQSCLACGAAYHAAANAVAVARARAIHGAVQVEGGVHASAVVGALAGASDAARVAVAHAGLGASLHMRAMNTASHEKHVFHGVF